MGNALATRSIVLGKQGYEFMQHTLEHIHLQSLGLKNYPTTIYDVLCKRHGRAKLERLPSSRDGLNCYMTGYATLDFAALGSCILLAARYQYKRAIAWQNTTGITVPASYR
jgi:hypothetical protein